MAFSVYRNKDNPFVTWDRSGKSSQLTAGTVPLTLSATTAVWRTFSNTYGYAFETNDLGPVDHAQPKITFYAHPNQAAGTVPMYRFRRPDPSNLEYFYAQSKSYDGNGWTLDVRGDASSNDKGIAFFVYPDATTPGTVPLYLYQDNRSKYILTTNQSEVTGASAVWAYVYPNSAGAPAPPHLTMPCCVCGNLVWDSISSNVTGFKVERRFDSEPGWSQIETETADVRSTFASCVAYDSSAKGSSAVYYRIRATSSNGDSAYSNEVSYHFCPKRALCPEGGEPDPVLPNHAPEIGIVSPANDDVVGNNLAITANAFDIEGNGTIVKVEFFANGNKLGEVTDAPYVLSGKTPHRELLA
jgi:hypothetical protein